MYSRNRDVDLLQAFLTFIVGVLIIFAVSHALAQEQPPETANSSSGGYDELTRGPVHEAFAEQVSLEPQAGIVVPEAPPEPIQELPPENRPADASALWIGGYWAWNELDADDAEGKGDFMWVSGVWRVPPRGHQWVPGYWTKVDTGFQWVGGFWTLEDRAEVTYLPQPPEILEEGPSSPAPSEAHFWVPGCWHYRGGEYVWRPGYWAALHERYVWIPEYYRWTPSGYIFCGGYWDYPLASRGFLFAPVHFHEPVYAHRHWHYRPGVVIDLGPLHFHLFVRPSYCHYYFGDYYGDHYAHHGYHAWHDYHTHSHAYDPLFAFDVARYRHRGIDFHDRIKRWHHWFDEHEEMRPRHTYAEQRRFEEEHRDRDGAKTAILANSFKDIVKDKRNAFVQFDERQGDSDTLRDRFSQLRKQREDIERGKDREKRVSGDSGDDKGDDKGEARRGPFPSLDLRGLSRQQQREGDRVRTLRPNIDGDEDFRDRGGVFRIQPDKRSNEQPAITPDSLPEGLRGRLDGQRGNEKSSKQGLKGTKRSGERPSVQLPRRADLPRPNDTPTTRRLSPPSVQQGDGQPPAFRTQPRNQPRIEVAPRRGGSDFERGNRGGGRSEGGGKFKKDKDD